MILHYKYEVVIFLTFWLPRNKDVKLYEAVRACTNPDDNVVLIISSLQSFIVVSAYTLSLKEIILHVK